MKTKHACKILRKYGLVRWNLTDQDISFRRNIIGYGNQSWSSFIIACAFGQYLNDTLPEKGIYIKELNAKFGGTTIIEMPSENRQE